MAALASVDDVADLLGLTSEGVDADQATAMLAQASAAFRAEARCEFDETEDTVILRVVGGSVDLPRRPVVEVSEIRRLNDDGTAGAVISAYRFDGISSISLLDSTVVFNATTCGPVDTVQVTYSHGFTEVPEDVRWTVAQMVARAISSPSPAAVTGETIGAYSYRTGSYSASGAMGMTPDERAVAHRYRPRTSTMSSVIY